MDPSLQHSHPPQSSRAVIWMDFAGFQPAVSGPIVDMPWHGVPPAKASDSCSGWAGPQDQAGQVWTPGFLCTDPPLSSSQHPCREEKGAQLWLPLGSRLLQEGFLRWAKSAVTGSCFQAFQMPPTYDCHMPLHRNCPGETRMPSPHG